MSLLSHLALYVHRNQLFDRIKSLVFLLFLRLLAESVKDVEENIVGQSVAPYLCASLCVHRYAAVAKLMKHVEPVN